jgi:hypothetical protein
MSNEPLVWEFKLGRRIEEILSADVLLFNGGVDSIGWWLCMDARSANVSIEWVEDARAFGGVEMVPDGTGDMRGEDCEVWWEGLRIWAGILEGGMIGRVKTGFGGVFDDPESDRWTCRNKDGLEDEFELLIAFEFKVAGAAEFERGASLGESSELMSMVRVKLNRSKFRCYCSPLGLRSGSCCLCISMPPHSTELWTRPNPGEYAKCKNSLDQYQR